MIYPFKMVIFNSYVKLPEGILPLAQDLSMFSHVFSLLFLHGLHAFSAVLAASSASSHAAFPKRIWSFWHQPPPLPRMVQLAMATWRTYAPDYEAGFDIKMSTSSSRFFWTWMWKTSHVCTYLVLAIIWDDQCGEPSLNIIYSYIIMYNVYVKYVYVKYVNYVYNMYIYYIYIYLLNFGRHGSWIV